MKYLLKQLGIYFAIILAFGFLYSQCAHAQEVNFQREGTTFTQVKSPNVSHDTLTKFTYVIKDFSYPIYITSNGRCYIIRTSKNGNEYKQYLAKEIALEICKELNIEYKETK